MTNLNYQRPLDKISFNGALSILVLTALASSSQANDIEPYQIYSIPSSSSASTHDYFSNESKLYSNLMDRVNEIASLDDNWNDFGASNFPAELIEKSKLFLSKIASITSILSIFPTASGSIQIEWEKENVYAEAEIFIDNIKIYAEKDDEEIVSSSFDNLSAASKEFLSIYKS